MFDNAVLAALAATTGLSWVMAIVCHLATRRALRAPRGAAGTVLPPVSVLKPLAGMDEQLLANLLTIVRQNYPTFEIIFGVESAKDPACNLVRKLQTMHPETRMRLVTGGPKIGVNPKVANLANMVRYAMYEHILISDANVRVGPDYLREVAGASADDVGLVCNILVGCDGESIGALCEDLHLNTFVTPSVCAAFGLANHPCVVGKSMLLRQSDLQRMGGWHAVADVLAEDYVLGQMTRRAGKRVVLSPYVVYAVHKRRPLRAFVERHVRWSQMRWRLARGAYMSELPGNTAVWAWAWCGAALAQAQYTQATLALVAGLTKMALDLLLHARLAGQRPGIRHAWALALKDLMQPGMWVLGILCRSVTWRGHSMRIGRGSVVQACVDVHGTAALPNAPFALRSNRLRVGR